jgi:hypothetical protein
MLVKAISPTLLEASEKEGRRIYQNNQNFKNLANLMEHPLFRKVYDEHFKDWTSLQVILLFMNLYAEIEKQSAVQLTGYQKIWFVKTIYGNSNLRPQVLKNLLLKQAKTCVSITKK